MERFTSLLPMPTAPCPTKNVRQGPDRQPGRDCTAHPARVQGARHRHRGGAFDRRRRRHARAARRRERVHRPAACRRKLSQHSAPARRLRDHRRRRRASRLRLPVGERALRRDPRRAPDHLHRPDVRAHPHHGRQDRGEGDRKEARHSRRAGLRRRRDQRARGDEDRQGDGFPRADQGDGRRRRPRHEGRAHAAPISASRYRPRAPRPRPPSATTASTWRSI